MAGAQGVQRITHAEFVAEAQARFGEDSKQWRFVCPRCGHECPVQAWKDVGAPAGAVAFSCIGRYTGINRPKDGGPCDWTLGGLFRIHRLVVVLEDGTEQPAFELAPRPLDKTPPSAREVVPRTNPDR